MLIKEINSFDSPFSKRIFFWQALDILRNFRRAKRAEKNSEVILVILTVFLEAAGKVDNRGGGKRISFTTAGFKVDKNHSRKRIFYNDSPKLMIKGKSFPGSPVMQVFPKYMSVFLVWAMHWPPAGRWGHDRESNQIAHPIKSECLRQHSVGTKWN